MSMLSYFDPDEVEIPKKIKKAEILEETPKIESDRCPTCQQKIEVPIPRTDIWKVIQVFKLASGHERMDKQWDILYYPRYMKPAKQLIAFMGDWKWAADAVQDIYERFTELGLMVTFETILKHSAEWKKNKQEREAKNGIYVSERSRTQETQPRTKDHSSVNGEEPRSRFHAV